jgi:hypothetical protein
MPTGLIPEWRQESSKTHHANLFGEPENPTKVQVSANGYPIPSGQAAHQSAKHDRLFGLN